jgi:hypothetical protein
MPRPAVSPGHRPAALAAVAVLLAAAIAGALWVPVYARLTPKLGPFPFFYWYQLVLIPAVAVLCWVCHLLIRGRTADGPDTTGAPR